MRQDIKDLLADMKKSRRVSLVISALVLGIFPKAKAGDGVFVACERKNNFPLQARVYHQRGGMEIHWATGMINKLTIVDFEKSVYKDQYGSPWGKISAGLNAIKLKQGDYLYDCKILDRF